MVERDRRTSSQFDQGWIDEFVRDGEEQQYTAGDLSLVFHGATLLKGTRLVLLPDDRIEPDPETTVVQSLRATAVVRHLREWLTTPHRVSDIVEHLSQRFAHGDVELRKYLRKLWSAGYLISESATSTNADVAGARLRLATRHPTAGPWIERAQQKLNALDATELGEPHRKAYATLQREGREHSAGSTPIMVDLHAPMSGTLGANVRAEVETLAELSLRNGRRLQCPTLTARFQRCFEGTLRFVPLLEAVDACLDLLSGDARELQPEPPASGAARQLLLDSMLAHAFATGSHEVVLSPENLDTIFPALDAQSELPETVELGFSIAARSLDDVNNDEFLVLPGAMFANHAVGATAARFHRMFRTRSEHGLHDLADDDCIRAELVYAPRGARELNIASRRVDAAYEIGVGVFPSGRNQLRLDDLWVGIDPPRTTSCCSARACRSASVLWRPPR